MIDDTIRGFGLPEQQGQSDPVLDAYAELAALYDEPPDIGYEPVMPQNADERFAVAGLQAPPIFPTYNDPFAIAVQALTQAAGGYLEARANRGAQSMKQRQRIADQVSQVYKERRGEIRQMRLIELRDRLRQEGQTDLADTFSKAMQVAQNSTNPKMAAIQAAVANKVPPEQAQQAFASLPETNPQKTQVYIPYQGQMFPVQASEQLGYKMKIQDQQRADAREARLAQAAARQADLAERKFRREVGGIAGLSKEQQDYFNKLWGEQSNAIQYVADPAVRTQQYDSLRESLLEEAIKMPGKVQEQTGRMWRDRISAGLSGKGVAPSITPNASVRQQTAAPAPKGPPAGFDYVAAAKAAGSYDAAVAEINSRVMSDEVRQKALEGARRAYGR